MRAALRTRRTDPGGPVQGRAEAMVGAAIRKLRLKRSDLVLATKIFWGGRGPNDFGLSRKHIVEGLQASLQRLQVDYVDVVFCHIPDFATPIEETVRAMNHVIDVKGWAFYWGTSGWTAEQIEEAWAIARRLGLMGPIVEQPQYNLLEREQVDAVLAPLQKELGLGIMVASPLKGGVLSGKNSQGQLPNGSRLALPEYRNLAQLQLGEKRAEIDKVDVLRP